MRACIVLSMIAAVALAQDVPASANGPRTTIPAGVPLRVALERRVGIKRVGQPIQGRLVDPIYVFDRLVLPAGSLVEGQVAEIGGVPFRRRLTCILSGNFTPPRDVRAQFDALVLGDGSRLSLRTTASLGTAHTARIAKPRKRPPGDAGAPDDPATILAFKTPGKMRRLESYLLGMLPYHPQRWQAGTLFNGALLDPLTAFALKSPPVAAPEAQDLRARLITSLNSATARRGESIEAVVTRPQFSADHRLLIPEGSRLLGEVVAAQKARLFHRNGKLQFAFRQIQVPAAQAQPIQGYLEGVEAAWDAHLTLDAEGAAHVSSPKTRFIFPVIAAAVAGLSFHQDYNAQGIPDQDIGGRAESGAVGLGLVGTLLAQVGPRALASSVAIAGAGFSVYSTFISRGENVELPVNTPLTISLLKRGDEPAGPAPEAPRQSPGP